MEGCIDGWDDGSVLGCMDGWPVSQYRKQIKIFIANEVED
jgi:hypothetical protein